MPKHDPATLSVVTVEDRASNFVHLVADLMPRSRGFDLPPMPDTMIQAVCGASADGELTVSLFPTRKALAWLASLARETLPDPVRSYRLES